MPSRHKSWWTPCLLGVKSSGSCIFIGSLHVYCEYPDLPPPGSQSGVANNCGVFDLFFQLLEDTCYTILNKPKPKPKAEPPPKEEEKKQEGEGDSKNEEKMDQNGGSTDKTNEQQGEEDKKPDPDMEIDWR